MTKTKKIIEILEDELEDSELFALYKEVWGNEESADNEEGVYLMKDIDNVLTNYRLREVIERINFNDFNFREKYFHFGDDGIESADYISDIVDLEILAEAVQENDEAMEMLKKYDTEKRLTDWELNEGQAAKEELEQDKAEIPDNIKVTITLTMKDIHTIAKMLGKEPWEIMKNAKEIGGSRYAEKNESAD